jgi:hypothetical protein
MKRAFIAAVLLFSVAGIQAAEKESFRKTKLADVKGKQADVNLTFDGSAKTVVVDVSSHVIASMPYGDIDKISYEFSKHHRVKQGAIVMVASLGAGAIVMLTSSKSHWLTFEYREKDVPKTLVLRLDKSEYKSVIHAAEAQTGKTVELLSDAKLNTKSKK